MAASHASYRDNAHLGSDACDTLVAAVARHAEDGLLGAKITGGGAGGTVAVLCEASPRADAALESIVRDYAAETGRRPELFTGSSDGAWHVGTRIVQGEAV